MWDQIELLHKMDHPNLPTFLGYYRTKETFFDGTRNYDPKLFYDEIDEIERRNKMIDEFERAEEQDKASQEDEKEDGEDKKSEE